MRAVVMAGGEGSRLRPLTSQRPKPLVPVAGRPIMEHILLLLRKHQMREVVATIQYLGAHIRNYFGDGSEQGVNLSYSVEDTPLGTAGSVKLAEDLLRETFVVISGDALTDIDLAAAVRFHKQRQAMATIVLKPVPNPLEYGVVVADEDGRVQRFLEKPSWGEVFSDLANTGIYVLDPAVFGYFKAGEVVDWSGDVFPQLLKEGEPIYGWVADGYWEDVGSHQAYLKANFDCLEGRVAVDIPAHRAGPNLWIAEDADVDADARIDGPALIAAGAKVRRGAWVNGPCVIGAYGTVDIGAKLSNSILWDHVYIGENSRLRGSVICRGATVKNSCVLEEGTVIGSEVVIGQGATVNANVRIWPNKEVEPGAVVRESIIWAGSWKRGLFTAYGLTGLANVEFTPEFSARLGAAVGALYPKGATLAISRDHTRSARMIHRAVASGLISSGANAIDLSALPIPTVRHWARRHRLPVMHVQSSPVDPRSIDIRIFDAAGLDLDKRMERKLENLYFREDVRRVSHYEMGQLSARPDDYGRYVEELLEKIDVETVRGAGLKVVVDHSNGASAQMLPRILQEMNCTVIPLNAAPAEIVSEQDEVAFRARLDELAVISQAVGANLGMFIDSPSERVFLVDDQGEVLAHDVAFAVLAQLALVGRPGVLLGPASASLAFSQIAERLESRFVPTKTTPGAVLRAAQHTETVLASDGMGGYCWPEFQLAFDGIFTTAKVLELLASSNVTLRELKAEVPRVGYERRVVFCPWDAKGRVMRMVMERHLEDRVDLTDGVKVFTEDGWALVVPDPDRPEYLVVASNSDPQHSAALADEYEAVVRAAVEEVRPDVDEVVEREIS
jgi:mannose-1-phosphate guanylyltransferase / phosphomannomutase